MDELYGVGGMRCGCGGFVIFEEGEERVDEGSEKFCIRVGWVYVCN